MRRQEGAAYGAVETKDRFWRVGARAHLRDLLGKHPLPLNWQMVTAEPWYPANGRPGATW